jgi:hypothetical protein
MPDKESRLDQRDDEKVGWTNGTIFAIDGDYLTTDAWVTGDATPFMKPGEVSS